MTVVEHIETVPFGRFTMSDLKDNLAVIVYLESSQIIVTVK